MNNRSHEILKQKRERIAASMEERIKGLQEQINVAMLYNTMLGSPAWKHLMTTYLDSKMDPQSLMAYLRAEEGSMKEEMIKMQALWDFVGFIHAQIANGDKAAKELHKLKVRGSDK